VSAARRATAGAAASVRCWQPRRLSAASAGSRCSTPRPASLTRMQFHRHSERRRVSAPMWPSPAPRARPPAQAPAPGERRPPALAAMRAPRPCALRRSGARQPRARALRCCRPCAALLTCCASRRSSLCIVRSVCLHTQRTWARRGRRRGRAPASVTSVQPDRSRQVSVTIGASARSAPSCHRRPHQSAVRAARLQQATRPLSRSRAQADRRGAFAITDAEAGRLEPPRRLRRPAARSIGRPRARRLWRAPGGRRAGGVGGAPRLHGRDAACAAQAQGCQAQPRRERAEAALGRRHAARQVQAEQARQRGQRDQADIGQLRARRGTAGQA